MFLTENAVTRTDSPTSDGAPAATGLSGKLVVIGMFAFGILLTGVLYGYWELHTRPFRPLQEALAREIPGSSPRVVGGRHKSHRESAPNTLRIIVQVPYDPLAEAQASDRDEMARRVVSLARANHDISPYELVEVHLEHRIPERPSEVWSSIRTPAEWNEFAPPASESKGQAKP